MTFEVFRGLQQSFKKQFGAVTGGGAHWYSVIGEMAQRTVDIVLNERLSEITADNGLLTKETVTTHNETARDNLDKFLEGWNKERNLLNRDALSVIQGEAGQSYYGARQITFEALRGKI